MSVRPNQPAIIVRDTMARGRETCFQKLIGAPLTMGEHIDTYLGAKVWTYRGKPLSCPDCGVLFPVVFEADLQPLRGSSAFASDSASQISPQAAPSELAAA